MAKPQAKNTSQLQVSPTVILVDVKFSIFDCRDGIFQAPKALRLRPGAFDGLLPMIAAGEDPSPDDE
jgi:hypothetical protein